MFSLIFGIVDSILGVYALLVLVHFILTLAKVSSNKWTTLLASIVEPALAVVRPLVNKYLPKKWQTIDWSPVALLIAISLVQWALGILGWILP